MPRATYPRVGYITNAQNEKPLYISRRSLSGGQDTRTDQARISDDEATVLYNVDIGVPGRVDKRSGLTLIANDTGTRTYALSPYYPTSGTDALYRIEGTNTRKWTGSGNWSSNLKTLTTSLDTCIIQGGQSGSNEVLFYQNPTDNPQVMDSSDTFTDMGTGSTAPPKSLFNLFFSNRWWVLKNGFLYYSSAFPSDYSTSFTGSNGFRFSGFGGDRGLFSIRDSDVTGTVASIIVFLQKAIWAISPSTTPASTDKPVILSSDHGAIDRKCIVQMGDDIAYLAPDGIRSLKRTINDKLQFGTSYPLSYRLRDEFDNIDFSKSSKFHMIFWRDKLFFFFVQTGGSDINRAWVYWPALDDGTGKGWAVITGWTITSAAKFFVSGDERLYGGSTDGKVYQLWKGGDDNGTAITETIETREEDFDKPSIFKYGGELEVVAEAVGTGYTIPVWAAIDGGAYTLLGTLSLNSNSPSLPVNLPFNLAASARVSSKFHLDSLGRFKRIKFKFTNGDSNGTDIIRILEYNCITFSDQYESE